MDSDTTFEALCDQQEAIETRDDLISFVEALRDDLRAHPTSWENGSLDAYLDVLATTVNAAEQLVKNRGERWPEQPTWPFVWRLFGDLLLATRIRE